MSDPSLFPRTEPDAAAAAGAIALAPGAQVGRYEIMSVLGHGGFGITYRARDGANGSEVALKEYLPVSLAVRQGGTLVLPRSTQAAGDFSWGRERFVTEGKTLASLEHAPAIVRLLDFVEANGTAYIAMELLHGETLEGRLRRGRLTVAEIGGLLWPLLDGLEEVHKAGFLHRDIKPANIMLDQAGRPTLIDFGAAREAMAGRTTALTAIFTPGFGAAEQFTAGKQGPWTDIYGLAATLHCAVTGAPPSSSVERLLDDTYRPLFARRGIDSQLAGLPPGIAAGIDIGLAVRSNDRPQAIAEWREVLQSTAPQAAIATQVMRRAPDTLTNAEPLKRRTGLFAGLAVAALALMAIAGAGGYYVMELRPAGQQAARSLDSANIEELERALTARRQADAEAADKRAAEGAARQRMEDEARAKQAADEALATAKQDSALAQAELERRQRAMDADNTEASQRERQKAMADMAAKREAEQEAQRKADADAEAKRRADEAFAKAQEERTQAEAAAKAQQEAETRMKADADARTRAEADARARAQDEEKQKALEAAQAKDRGAETALNLTADERKRLQVALSSLGYDTRGSDGNFGPRTREMVAAWQTAAKQPPTGYLDNGQRQALLKAASAAVAKFDDEQKKIADEKKKAEDDKKAAEQKQKEEDEKKKQAAAAPSTPAPAQIPPVSNPPAQSPATPTPNAAGGTFAGSVTISHFVGAEAIVSLQLAQSGSTLRGELAMTLCGKTAVSLAVSPTGQVSGTMETFNGQKGCAREKFTVNGQIGDAGLKFSMSSVGAKASGTLARQ